MTAPRLSSTERFQEYLAARTTLRKLRAVAESEGLSAEEATSSTNTAIAQWTSGGGVSGSGGSAATIPMEPWVITNIGTVIAGNYVASQAAADMFLLTACSSDATSAVLQPLAEGFWQTMSALGSMVVFGSYATTDSEDLRRADAVRFLEAQTEIPFAQSVARRLESLMRVAPEEEEVPTLSSLWGFVRLLTEFKGVKRPSVSLSPGGLIYARWKDEGGKLFGVRFVDESKVRFVVFRANPNQPEIEERFSGETTLDDVFQRAKGVGGIEWVFDSEG